MKKNEKLSLRATICFVVSFTSMFVGTFLKIDSLAIVFIVSGIAGIYFVFRDMPDVVASLNQIYNNSYDEEDDDDEDDDDDDNHIE